MKKFIQFTLQKLLGFNNYLFLFSVFRIFTLKFRKSENDFYAFMGLFNDESKIIDIGANIGIMTGNLARKFKKGTIYSFEPIPQNMNTLKKIVKFFRFNNVKLFECALGETNEQLEMVMPKQKGVLMQGLSHVKKKYGTLEEVGLTFKVKQRKLDDINELYGVVIDGIKIDAENYEYYVLKGAKNILVEYKPIIYCEIWNNNERNRTFNFLADLNYKAKIFDGKELVDYVPMKHHTDNFFFIYNN